MRSIVPVVVFIIVALIGWACYGIWSMGSFVTQSNPFIKDYAISARYNNVHSATWQVINTNSLLLKTVPVYDSQHYDYYNDSIHYVTLNILIGPADTTQFTFHFLGDSVYWAKDPTTTISLKYTQHIAGRQLSTKEKTDIFERELITKVNSLILSKKVH